MILLLAAIGGAAAWWCFERGYTLYFGDAEAHLNIARRVLDSRTPGPYQIGTVWLPLPHVVLIPFVMHDAWWRSGLAGVFPSIACFVLAGTFLFAAARRIYGSLDAALAAALLFALNPNILYLQATPMTELLFLASLAALLWATVWFRDAQSLLPILIAAAASNAASLTRYEGWFLIPFVSLYLLMVAKRRSLAIVFAILAALGPLAWLAHNRYYYSNALEFYNGPYSAGAIYRRQLAQGMAPYPGDHDWFTAARYYFTAGRLVGGIPLMLAGAAGIMAMLLRRLWWPLLLLALPPAFYVWSMHSSSTPIFVPSLP
ncbi:MAG TPA: glycosyltransferase family 39 protein, partial [Bryobacteraceae bacterium]